MSNVFRLLKPYFEEATGQAFVSGIKVLVQVTVSSMNCMDIALQYRI